MVAVTWAASGFASERRVSEMFDVDVLPGLRTERGSDAQQVSKSKIPKHRSKKDHLLGTDRVSWRDPGTLSRPDGSQHE